jgi:hypothetical protein
MVMDVAAEEDIITDKSSSSSTTATAMPAQLLQCNSNSNIPVHNNNNNNNRIPLNKQWILQLEGALQLHLNQTKKNKISYSDFCTLVPKLILDNNSGSSSSTAAATTTTTTCEDVRNLSKEERLWHDLYVVAVPALYKLTTTTDDDSTAVAAAATIIELEVLPFSGNRWKEVRRLLEQVQSSDGAALLGKRSQEAIHLLHRHSSLRRRSSNNIAAATASTSTSSSKKDDDDSSLLLDTTNKNPLPMTHDDDDSMLLRPEMNLEQRVRARAQRREHLLQQAEEARKDPKEERLAVADALFSHARHILRRRRGTTTTSRTSKSKTTANTKCVLTFQDVLRVVPQNNSSSISKTQLSSLLQSMTVISPGWIRWMDPKSGDNGVPISKKATVWIETADYKSVRAKLSGEQPPQVVDATTSSSSSTFTTTRTMVLPAVEKTPPPSTAKRLGNTRVVTVSGTKRSAAAAEADPLLFRNQKSLKSLTASADAFQKRSAAAADNGPPLEDALHNNNSKKRSAEEPSSSSPRTTATADANDEQHANGHKKKQRRGGLRVNHNFILTDADYDGGGIIQASLEMPRGLRRLFLQLNAGEQI